MNKYRIMILAALLVTAVLWWQREGLLQAWRDAPAHVPGLAAPATAQQKAEAPPAAQPATPHRDAPVEAYRAELAAEAEQSDPRLLARQLVFALYDELAEALDAPASGCEELAERMNVVVSERGPEVKQALQGGSPRPPQPQVEVELDEATRQRIKHFGDQLSAHMEKCPAELMPLMKQLSSLEAPSDG